MDTATRLRQTLISWAAGDTDAPHPAKASAARELAAELGLRTVVLVEGVSDRAAVEALAVRRGRDLTAEGVVVVPLGGATGITRFLRLLGRTASASGPPASATRRSSASSSRAWNAPDSAPRSPGTTWRASASSPATPTWRTS